MIEGNLLFQIKKKYEELDPAEKKLADYILQQVSYIPYVSMDSLADEVNISKTTVIRFCKKLGFKGFKDFKIGLLKFISIKSSHSISGADIPEELNENFDPSKLLFLVIQRNLEMFNDLNEINKPEALNSAIDLIMNAQKVVLIGVGSSVPVVLDAEHRFVRLGINCNATTDTHFQVVRTLSLSKEDLILAISYSGHTNDIYECLKIAKKRGVKVVSITSFPSSPIAKIADSVLLSATRRTPFPSESTASRISQMTLIDFICAGVYLRKKESIKGFLKEIELILANKRV